MAGVNVDMHIPSMLVKLKQLAKLPLRLVMASAESGEHGGAKGLVRSAPHLFNRNMGKVVGNNGYRIACKREFSAYTILWDAPLIFCSPNITDNNIFASLLTQDRSVNLDEDADIDLATRYE